MVSSFKYARALKESQAAAHQLWLQAEASAAKVEALETENAELRRKFSKSRRLLREALRLLDLTTHSKHELAVELERERSEPALVRARAENRRLARALVRTAARPSEANPATKT